MTTIPCKLLCFNGCYKNVAAHQCLAAHIKSCLPRCIWCKTSCCHLPHSHCSPAPCCLLEPRPRSASGAGTARGGAGALSAASGSCPRPCSCSAVQGRGSDRLHKGERHLSLSKPGLHTCRYVRTGQQVTLITWAARRPRVRVRRAAWEWFHMWVAEAPSDG